MIVIRNAYNKELLECFDTCRELKQYVDDCLDDCDWEGETQADKFRAFEEMFGKIYFE